MIPVPVLKSDSLTIAEATFRLEHWKLKRGKRVHIHHGADVHRLVKSLALTDRWADSQSQFLRLPKKGRFHVSPSSLPPPHNCSPSLLPCGRQPLLCPARRSLAAYWINFYVFCSALGGILSGPMPRPQLGCPTIILCYTLEGIFHVGGTSLQGKGCSLRGQVTWRVRVGHPGRPGDLGVRGPGCQCVSCSGPRALGPLQTRFYIREVSCLPK